MQHNAVNSWTAAAPGGGTLSINMSSEEKINLSGKISYLDYNCEFSTAMEKNQANSIDPSAILDGTWTLDGTQSGGCLADISKVTAAVIPEAASIAFSVNNNAKAVNSVSSSKISRMKTSAAENSSAVFQSVKPSTEAELVYISENVYKLTDKSGNETLIFVENTDEIFVIKNESEDNTVQTTEFLPLKKVNLDIETALKKNWTASESDGGGWAHFNAENFNLTTDPAELEFLKLLENISFTLKNAALNFSGVTANDDGTITASMNISASFTMSNELLDSLGMSETFSENTSEKVTMTKSGNSWNFENDGDIYTASFVSDNKLILSIKTGGGSEGEGEFIIRFSAD